MQVRRSEKFMPYIILIMIILFVSAFYFNNTFDMIENPLLDRLVAEGRETNPNIKILAIDEESLEAIGKWPWPRDIMAKVAEDLVKGGARAVWLDILYTEKSHNPAEDEAWAEVMANTNGIYHSMYFELAEKQAKNLPLQVVRRFWPVFPVSPEQVGLINVLPDRDGVVRQAVLGIPDENGDMVYAIDVVLANLLLPEDQRIRWDGAHWRRGEEILPANAWNQVYFSFASTPHTPGFEVLPIAPVVSGELDPGYFEDAIVLIGPYAVGMSDDLFATPGSKNVRMFGVEIHANIIQGLYDNQLYRMASKALGTAVIALLAILAFFLMERLKAKWSALALIGFLVAYVLIHIIVFDQKKLLLPFFYPLLAVFLTYVATVVLQYLKERRERNRVTEIFGRYVSKSVVKEILGNREAIQLGGIRRDITVVFVDIRGFTPLSEKMQPEEVILILNEYLDLCTRAVFAFEGTLDKELRLLSRCHRSNLHQNPGEGEMILREMAEEVRDRGMGMIELQAMI